MRPIFLVEWWMAQGTRHKEEGAMAMSGYYDIIVGKLSDSQDDIKTFRKIMRLELEDWRFHKRTWKAESGVVLEERPAEVIVTRFMGQDIEFLLFRPAHKASKRWGCIMHVKGNCIVRAFASTRKKALLQVWGEDK